MFKHLLTYLIDSIIVGELEVFKEKHFNAMYKDGAIYVSNIQDDNEDMIDDIVTPMTDEALLLERALDKLSTTEVMALDQDITPLKKARKMQKAQEKAKKTFKQEQTIEDAMKVAYE